jgi:hypothetical protein
VPLGQQTHVSGFVRSKCLEYSMVVRLNTIGSDIIIIFKFFLNSFLVFKKLLLTRAVNNTYTKKKKN